MTAEIAVMNQEAVALAADSAVSGQTKIFTSANKIFALSKYHPVAIMVYDNAQFVGVPWETIVKTYRSELGERAFPTLRQQAAHFLGFFHDANPLFPPESQQRCNQMLFVAFFNAMLAYIDQTLEEATAEGHELSDDDVADLVSGVIRETHDAATNSGLHPAMPQDFADDVKREYGEIIEDSIGTLENLPIDDDGQGMLVDLAVALVAHDKPNALSPFHAGVVIAGFGRDEYFPSFYEFELETIALNRLKYTQTDEASISSDNRAVVKAFAQSEQVATFMEGIDSIAADAMTDYWHAELNEIVGRVATQLGLDDDATNQLLEDMADANDAAINEFREKLAGWQHEMYVQPIIRVVAMMPKDELAAMAESLVNLTSFKRKVTEVAETVGGPIDVAVISRGDGLVWVKRKHYFRADLNQQFFANYYREETR